MKRYLLLLISAMLFSTTTTFAQGGTTGPLTWNISGHILTISGNGAMLDYHYPSYAPWYQYNPLINAVVIEYGVTSIGDHAFNGCWLSSITIANSVTSIGSSAFSNSHLASVIIPNSVITIGNSAFFACMSMTSVTIPNSVITIGNSAFSSCVSLTSITIPSSVTTIEENAFFNCESLTSIDVESGNNAYASESGVLFDKNKTTLICCPAGKTGAYIIPSSVTTIGRFAFNFSNLTSVTIPSSVTAIEYGAFFAFRLTSITIPSSVTTINNAFAFCPVLTSIDVESGNSAYASENGVLFDKNKTTLICYPMGKTADTYVIPSSVTTIGESAFNRCSLISITIPSSVVTIGRGAFAGSSLLTSIIIPSGVTTIEDGTFQSCSSLASITIPSSVITIGNAVFYSCHSLTSIINFNPMPIEIDSYVFEGVNQSACTLKVLTSAVSAYQNAAVWQEFNIVGGYYHVQVGVNNEEYGTAIGDGYYNENETAIVTATANEGYKFVNWTKDGIEVSADNPYSFTATEDMELIANFEEEGETYLVSVSVNNEEYGAVTGGGYYEENETATATATAYTGYKFVNWTKDGIEVSTDNPYSFIVTEDIELIANFEEKVGIENIEVTVVKIYPNPTTGELKIESGELIIENVKVFDIYGKVLKTESRRQKGKILMDISELPVGVYFLRIKTEQGEVVKKVLKE